MDMIIADTFLPSLKRMINRQRWYWKLYDAIRYDTPRFVRAFWRYRNDMWNDRPWDAMGSMRFVRTHLNHLANYLEKYSNEVEESLNKKIAKIRRAVELLDHYIEDKYIDLAEERLGKTVTVNFKLLPRDKDSLRELKFTNTEQEELDNKEIFALSSEIEEKEWFELFEILRGQDIELYRKDIEKLSQEDKNNKDHWNKWYDGSGLKGWWN